MTMAPPLQTPQRPAASRGGGSTVTPFKTPHRTPGEQTSQTPIVDFDLIEKQKENVAPSAKGRSAHSLSQMLPLEHKQRMDKLNAERKAWEQRVSPDSLAEENDPLSVWVDYIKWVKESCPSGGKSVDSGLVPLLERATRSLMEDERNHQTYSYLDIWIQYSRIVDKPDQILAWLLANEIGTTHATLYEEAADVSRDRVLYESADSLYRLGISRNAQPLKRLQKKYKEFQDFLCQEASSTSSSRRPISYKEALEDAMRQSRRSMLGIKDERTGRSQHANVVRGLGQSAGLAQQAVPLPNNGRKLSIFSDADGSQSGNGRGPTAGPLGSRDVRRQENVKEAKSWGGERILQKAGTTTAGAKSAKAPLQIFQDSDDEEGDASAAASPTKKRDVFSSSSSKPTLGSKCPESDRLKQNPFGNWDNKVQDRARQLAIGGLTNITALASVSQRSSPSASSTASSSSKRTEKPPSSKSKPSTSSSASKKPVPAATATSTAKRPERLAVPEHLLYPPTTGKGAKPLESCMEEILAGRLGYALNLQGNGDDPWAYLDVIEQEEEDESVNMSLSVVEAEDEEQEEDEDDEQSPSSGSDELSPPPTSDSREGSATPTRNDVAFGLKTAMPSREASATPTQSPVATRKQFIPAHAQPTEPRQVDADKKHFPSPTIMTKAAEAEIRALFNGADEESGSEGTSSCTTSDDEDDDEEGVKVSAAVPPTPTPASRTAPTQLRSLDENAMVKATPLRTPASSTAPRTALGSLPAATPMRKPLGAVAATALGGAGKRGIFVEEDVTEEQPREVVSTAAKPAPFVPATHTLAAPTEDDEDEESDAEEEDAETPQNAPWAPHELTTITERTEYDTRWGMATPGRNNTIMAVTEEDEEEEEEGPSELHAGPVSHALVQNAPNPCSPTDPDVIELVLKSIARPIESSPEYKDLTTERSEKLAVLKKQIKAGASSRKSLSGGAEVAVDGITFAVREMLGEGAYGSVFLAEDVDNRLPIRRRSGALGGIAGDSDSFAADEDIEGDIDSDEDEDEAERRRMVAIKVETPPNKWEFYILGQLRARLDSRSLQSIISARRFIAYQDESYLILEWGEKGTLLELVNQATSAGVAPVNSSSSTGASSGVEEILAMFFAVELLRIIESLHRSGLIHGDLKIDNCLLRLDEDSSTTWTNTYHADGSHGWSAKGLYLVDFGRAVDMSVFDETQKFIADWEVDTRDCLEMREGRPWTYEVDYFGIAAIVHVLLFGRYISTEIHEGRQRLAHGATLKRYWQVDLWSRFFDLLLNPGWVGGGGGGSSTRPLPIHDELETTRNKMEDWLAVNANKGGKNLKGLLKKLEIWSMGRRV